LLLQGENALKYKEFKQKVCGQWCRRCINAEYHLDLETSDCLYFHFPLECERCGEVRNIVTDIRFMKRLPLRKIK